MLSRLRSNESFIYSIIFDHFHSWNVCRNMMKGKYWWNPSLFDMNCVISNWTNGERKHNRLKPCWAPPYWPTPMTPPMRLKLWWPTNSSVLSIGEPLRALLAVCPPKCSRQTNSRWNWKEAGDPKSHLKKLR